MIKNTRYTLTGTRLAKLCGVSQGTVDRALHGRSDINPETREKILSVAKKYGFIFPEDRPDMSTKRGVIGVVVLDVSNEYFSNLIMYIESYCREIGYAISVMFSLNDPKNELTCIESLYRMGVDGLILCPVGGGKDEDDMEIYRKYLLSLDIPVVTVGNKISGINYVGIDDYRAMKEVTEKVISLGYKRLIYTHPLQNNSDVYAGAQLLRKKAFTDTTGKYGSYTIVCKLPQALEIAADCSKNDAFICSSDLYALRLLNLAESKGAGIIGFDNVSAIDTIGLGLDSVSYDIKMTAEKVMSLVCGGKKEESSEIIIKHNIISRGSL
ncbi:MAG: LacI family DNA-binding transcriptional regulator [Ruminiclostridium sp.]|nr:LacI family DNA-binding transcriptional regulator [Clostridia bacterium]MBQ8410269.1 LacI family DNA-binding transcriptional regulator [Ruminiclostridium sp.]